MTVRAKLKDLAPGTVFNAGPIDVRVLEHFADGRTLLIADTCIADRRYLYRRPPLRRSAVQDQTGKAGRKSERLALLKS